MKAKTIRDRLSTGGIGVGSGSNKYDGYSSKNYKNTPTTYTGGNISGVGSTAYGDYGVQESTLSKYKDKNEQKKVAASPLPDITGLGGNSTSVAQENTSKAVAEEKASIVMEEKKPF